VTDLDMTVDIKPFLKGLEKLGDQLPDVTGKAVMAGINVAEQWIGVELAREKSGKIYMVNHGRQTHRASAPGEAPAMETGFLANSIMGQLVEATKERAVAMLAVFADYGIHLEFGTKFMAARPFLRPSFDLNRGAIIAAVANTFSKWNPKT